MKIKNTLSSLVYLLLVAGFTTRSDAAPALESAKITIIQKDVSVADLKIASAATAATAANEIKRRKALLQEVVGRNNAVITGEQSRAELQFNDGTITRLGQLTSFTFTPGTREMNLKQGTILLQVPKGMGGTKIQAGPVSAGITGTTLMVQVFNSRVVVFVYEGSVEINGRSLDPGEAMNISNDGATEVLSFDPVEGAQSAALFTEFEDAESSDIINEALEVGLAQTDRDGDNEELSDLAVLDDLDREDSDLQIAADEDTDEEDDEY